MAITRNLHRFVFIQSQQIQTSFDNTTFQPNHRLLAKLDDYSGYIWFNLD